MGKYREREQDAQKLREFVEYGEMSGKAESAANFRRRMEAQRAIVRKRKHEVDLAKAAYMEEKLELDKLENDWRIMCMEEHERYAETFVYNDFSPNLTNTQIRKLLPTINHFVFEDRQTIESMREWLECRNAKPVRVKGNAEICLLLNLLAEYEYIGESPLSTAEEKSTFASRRGTKLTRKNLSNSLSSARLRKNAGFAQIESALRERVSTLSD